VRYKDVLLDCGYRIDLIVSADLIVEVKSVETLLPIHQAQILTYMRLAKIPIGLVINFNVTKLQNGIKRFVLLSASCSSCPSWWNYFVTEPRGRTTFPKTSFSTCAKPA
jgi:hypothetical protein